MIYTWFKIFNEGEFEASNLVSRTYTVNLEDIGQKDILVTKGNLVSMTYEGVMLSLDMNDANPFEFEGLAIYRDENDDVWLGIAVPDED